MTAPDSMDPADYLRTFVDGLANCDHRLANDDTLTERERADLQKYRDDIQAEYEAAQARVAEASKPAG